MSDGDASGQLALTGSPAARARRKPDAGRAEPLAEDLPVARVLVEVPLPHLDRPFDYSVPAGMAEAAVPGARVSVRFAGAVSDGFIVQRLASSDHEGRLSRLRRVISAEPVLMPEIAMLARAVADRYSGTVADVLRLAVPPRHGRTEDEPSSPAPPAPVPPEAAGWARYPDGPSLLAALASGGRPRAVWNPSPPDEWPDLLARLVAATLAGGRGAIVVVPDVRDADRLDAALTDVVGADQHVVLTADLGPAERYRRWLAARRGRTRAVIGTRSAVYAPVSDLGLVAVWDDGDDLHAEPRAPYPHVREVALLRAHHQRSAAVIGGFARTAEAEHLVSAGWARALTTPRELARAAAPRVLTVGDDREQERDAAAISARIPSLAWHTARQGLVHGPVLVQVPRSGYVPGFACGRCRSSARCPACHGPMRIADAAAPLSCAWCGQAEPWQCPECGGAAVRATALGVRRTAEELGRAFPGVPVRLSRGDAVLDTVDDRPALVVATPGAEPPAQGEYPAAILLDGQALLTRPGLRAAEEALRRWFGAAALVRPGTDGGRVVVVADPAAPAVQALVRWDPSGFAARELADRASLRFPPSARVAELTGAAADVAAVVEQTDLPPGADLLGPVPAGENGDERLLIRVPRGSGADLARALKAAQGVRSAKKAGGAVRVRVDPVELG